MSIFAFPESLRQLAEFLRLDAAELVRKLAQVVFIWLFAFAAWRLVRLIARRIVTAVDDHDDTAFTEREQRGYTIAQLLKSLGRVVIVGVAILLSLNVFVNIGPLLAGAGILGLAVSFGAQSLVKDVIAGFFFLLEGQFAVGDVIEVAGRSGVVERMTLRVVMLRDANGVVHMIPNGQITTVSNMTRTWSRAVVDVGVAYGTDVDRALEVFRDEAERFAKDEHWSSKFDGDPEVVGVNSLDESQITIRTQFRTHAGQQWAVGREFRRRILTRLAREGIEIPFPARSVSLRIADAKALAKAVGQGSDGQPEAPPESADQPESAESPTADSPAPSASD
ncbi:MAG TPA: mechanosensitive ion channel family protein [Gemmatimonadales bacterium]